MHLFEALTSHSARICVMALNDRVSGLREFGSALVNFSGLVLCVLSSTSLPACFRALVLRQAKPNKP
jgi:hypothetical protein